MEKLIRLTLIALTWLSNMFKVFITGVIGQFDFLDIPAFTTGCLESKVIFRYVYGVNLRRSIILLYKN